MPHGARPGFTNQAIHLGLGRQGVKQFGDRQTPPKND